MAIHEFRSRFPGVPLEYAVCMECGLPFAANPLHMSRSGQAVVGHFPTTRIADPPAGPPLTSR
jgi:hypothetical protein